MPAVRRRRALAVAAATVGLVAASMLLAAPAMADGHGHGHGNGASSAGPVHPGKQHGAARHHGHDGAPTATQHGVTGSGDARSISALRHDIATAAVRAGSAQGPGRSAQAHQRGRARAAQVAHRHGRHAVVTSPGAGKGQQPNVRTGPVATTPAVNPVVATRPVIAPGRAAERVAIAHQPVAVAQRPPVAGDGGVRVGPPLQDIVHELGNVARFSLFGGPIGWAMSGVLLVALLMMSTAFAVGRRRGASRNSAA